MKLNARNPNPIHDCFVGFYCTWLKKEITVNLFFHKTEVEQTNKEQMSKIKGKDNEL